MTGPTLVVVDMQQVFGDPASPWFTPRFADAEAVIAGMVPAFDHVVFTRFIAPENPGGAWVPYYEQWPFALVPETDALYDLMPVFAGSDHPVVTRTTFSKWGDELAALAGDDIVLVGVSTDCCVLSTALAAADAGVHVTVVSDGCAGLSDLDHQRALDVMALYGPLIEVAVAAEVRG